MTITISPPAWDELLQQENVEPSPHPDPDDALDVMYKHPASLGSGYWRTIQLREGLSVTIGNFRLRDRIITPYSEGEADWLEYHFHISGVHQTEQASLSAGQFSVSGSGSAPKTACDFLDVQPYLEVIIHMQPERLRSFTGDSAGQLPIALQPLIRQPGQECYCRTGTATPAMQTIVRQILQCPYQGLSKRLYLEGSATTLIGLVVAQEVEIWGGTSLSHSPKLDVVDRVYHARDILRQQLDNPPSLMELARLVGLNECTLKRGFRQIFDTTAFGYLHDYRMEQARQLLATGEMKVAEVADAIGFADRSYFAAAFRKKFGCNPSALKRRR